MEKKRRNGKVIRKTLCYLALVLLSIIFMFPLYWFFLNSIKSYEQIFQYPPKFFVWPMRFENYGEAYQYSALDFEKMLKGLRRHFWFLMQIMTEMYLDREL